MILGSSDPTPYDLTGVVVLAACGAVLLLGVLTGPSWTPVIATITRRGLFAVAALVFIAILVLTPTRNGVIGAGRLLSIWPIFILDGILFGLWSWRAGRL